MHNTTDALSRNPTQPGVSQKDPPPRPQNTPLCNDSGVMQRKRQRAVRDEPRKTKETKRPGESRVVSPQAASDFSLFLASKKSFGLSSRAAPRRRRGGPRGVVLQRPGVHVFQQPRLVRTEAKGGGRGRGRGRSIQAGLRTVCGSNLRPGRNPSSAPGTSSTRRTPGGRHPRIRITTRAINPLEMTITSFQKWFLCYSY